MKEQVNDDILSTVSPWHATAVNLRSSADLKQQQIGELDEHGNINLTMGSQVFAGKHTFNRVNCTNGPVGGACMAAFI